jgi:hypothetical protein
LKGLKFNNLDMIVLPIDGRDRIRPPRELSVAVTRRASLSDVNAFPRNEHYSSTNLWSSCSIPNSLSSKPDASASRLEGGIIGWSRGTSAREISF